MTTMSDEKLAPDGTFYNGWFEHGKLKAQHGKLRDEHEALQAAHKRVVKRLRRAERHEHVVEELIPLLREIQVADMLDNPTMERLYDLVRLSPTVESVIERWAATNREWSGDDPTG